MTGCRGETGCGAGTGALRLTGGATAVDVPIVAGAAVRLTGAGAGAGLLLRFGLPEGNAGLAAGRLSRRAVRCPNRWSPAIDSEPINKMRVNHTRTATKIGT